MAILVDVCPQGTWYDDLRFFRLCRLGLQALAGCFAALGSTFATSGLASESFLRGDIDHAADLQASVAAAHLAAVRRRELLPNDPSL